MCNENYHTTTALYSVQSTEYIATGTSPLISVDRSQMCTENCHRKKLAASLLPDLSTCLMHYKKNITFYGTHLYVYFIVHNRNTLLII